MDADQAVAGIAQRQLGLITHAQATRCGLSNRQIRHRVAIGRWEAVRPNVALISGTPRSWPQIVLSAVLAAGEGAVASHRTAARIWALPIPRGEALEISVPIERRPRIHGVVVHRTGTLHELDVAKVASVPVTSPARTLGDLSSALDVELFGRALDDGLRRGIVSLAGMHAVSTRFSSISPGRSPKTMTAALAARIPGYDPGDSDLETDIWNAIRDAGLPTPDRLPAVRIGARTLKPDLAYPGHKVAIEIDGFSSHNTRSAFDIDRVRQNAFVLDGWRVLRFTSRSTAPEIAATVARALFGREATPRVT